MELFACDLHINQILVDNSTGGGGSGAGRGSRECEGVLVPVQVPVCAPQCMWGGLPTPSLLAPCLAASLVH